MGPVRAPRAPSATPTGPVLAGASLARCTAARPAARWTIAGSISATGWMLRGGAVTAALRTGSADRWSGGAGRLELPLARRPVLRRTIAGPISEPDGNELLGGCPPAAALAGGAAAARRCTSPSPPWPIGADFVAERYAASPTVETPRGASPAPEVPAASRGFLERNGAAAASGPKGALGAE